jgi:RNA polymerase sigma factor (sigma-70 family)
MISRFGDRLYLPAKALVFSRARERSMPEISEDATLVGAAQRGDRAAFGALYQRYARMVHGVLLARVPIDDVDDLVQDVFLIALKRLAALREPRSFGPWLAAITRNRANDHYRRYVAQDQLPDDDSAAGTPGGNSKIPPAMATEVLEAVRTLPQAYRETLILRLVEQMTGPEIAARTGLTPGSVRVNLHRGMQQLRAKLSLMDTGRQQDNQPHEPISDYLWDKSGEPDPEIQRLESLLQEFQHDQPVPAFPAVNAERRWKWIPRGIRFAPAMAAAATIVVVAAVAILVTRQKTVVPTSLAGWNVSVVSGRPRVGFDSLASGSARFSVGQILETDQASRVSLQADNVGLIEVEKNTRLRLLTMAAGLKRIALDRGTIHARIWARPGEFVVDTPSALTVDLGCVYSLHVDDSGSGLVRTSMGWVGFTLNGRESFIPAGAACATRRNVGPGTPYFEDTSEKFRTALARFDFEDQNSQTRSADLAVILNESRQRDALTLWHLLSRVGPAERPSVYDRLQKLAPRPVSVSREAVLRLDQPALDRWWNELGFDDMATWRRWERAWPEASTQGEKN